MPPLPAISVGGVTGYLLVRREIDGAKLKFCLSNAKPEANLRRLADRQAARHFVERAFEDAKGACGMADYPVRGWQVGLAQATVPLPGDPRRHPAFLGEGALVDHQGRGVTEMCIGIGNQLPAHPTAIPDRFAQHGVESRWYGLPDTVSAIFSRLRRRHGNSPCRYRRAASSTERVRRWKQGR